MGVRWHSVTQFQNQILCLAVCRGVCEHASLCGHAPPPSPTSENVSKPGLLNRRRGRVGKGVGHLAHVWSYSVREVVSSNPVRGNIVGWVFHPTRWLARFSLIWICLSCQILNLFRSLSSWGSINYRPSANLLYEVASHVKKLPFRPILYVKLKSRSILWHVSKSHERQLYTVLPKMQVSPK